MVQYQILIRLKLFLLLTISLKFFLLYLFSLNFEKIYQTLKIVLYHISKHLQICQSSPGHCMSSVIYLLLEMWKHILLCNLIRKFIFHTWYSNGSEFASLQRWCPFCPNGMICRENHTLLAKPTHM